MGWVKEAIKELKEGKSIKIKPQGGSMRGRIESGQEVVLSPVNREDIKVNDVVLVKWKDNYLLHLIKDVKDSQILIGNNLGKENGWVSINDVIAIVIE